MCQNLLSKVFLSKPEAFFLFHLSVAICCKCKIWCGSVVDWNWGWGGADGHAANFFESFPVGGVDGPACVEFTVCTSNNVVTFWSVFVILSWLSL